MSELIRSESLQGFITLVTQLGGDSNQLLEKLDLPLQVAQHKGLYMSYRKYAELLELSAATLNCDDFGIRLAAYQDFDILGPLALAAKQATNLSDAFGWINQYIHFHTPGLETSMIVLPDNDNILLNVNILLNPLPPVKQTLELTLALACQFIDLLSNGRCKPQMIYLPHQKSKNSKARREIFACPVVYQDTIAAIVIKSNDLMIPLSLKPDMMAESALNFLNRSCDAKLFGLKDQVAALIRPLLMIEQCDNQTVSLALGLGVRQLHRKLRQQGTSFIQIKNQVRQQLAEQYLAQDLLPIGQISTLLGYQEQSAFCKACQIWFKQSAKSYREQLINGLLCP
ncbi:MAG: AraC family transcriptional regulator ligand-binding domain-containing protein [Gammaproteobacteria bacterium]|nr:AraC family transcriptional regulator ligand-binding domain-containing protein [Gammaproteobacteria bacterium]